MWRPNESTKSGLVEKGVHTLLENKIQCDSDYKRILYHDAERVWLSRLLGEFLGLYGPKF